MKILRVASLVLFSILGGAAAAYTTGSGAPADGPSAPIVAQGLIDLEAAAEPPTVEPTPTPAPSAPATFASVATPAPEEDEEDGPRGTARVNIRGGVFTDGCRTSGSDSGEGECEDNRVQD